MPISWQRFTFWFLALIAISMIGFVPIFVWRYGSDILLSQAFAEGIVIEVFGAVGTAILVVNIEIMANNTGLSPNSEGEQSIQIQALHNELAEIREELKQLNSLLKPTEDN